MIAKKEELLDKVRNPIAFFLENIRSAHNVGAAFRLGDAFWITHIYCGGFTPTPGHPQIRKTALGAEEHIPWTQVKNPIVALQALKKEGYTVIAVEQTEDAIPLQKVTKAHLGVKSLFIFGHEVFGVSQEALALADHKLVIPQHGLKKSLNVSTCMGIVAWEAMQVLKS